MLRADAEAPAVVDTSLAAVGPAPSATPAAQPIPSGVQAGPVYAVLWAICFCHLLNDMMQSLVPAIYPLLKESYGLDFMQVGFITFTWQAMASLLQPIIGTYTDKHPKPYSLAFGMLFTFAGLVMIGMAHTYTMLLFSVALIGAGSSIFHPESSRVARLASGGRYGLAQSIFQVGGNVGTAIGPLAAALIVLRNGQGSVSWFAVCALIAGLVLFRVGAWYAAHLAARINRTARPARPTGLSRRTTSLAIAILISLSFSKSFYTASITSYFQFYVIDRFHVDVQTAQLYLFLFTGSVALGTFIGGPLGDRFGRKTVLLISVLGTLPFSLALPYANLFWTGVLVVMVGLILASTFSVIVVYAQELLPGKVGLVAGIFFGLSFGLSGLGAAVLGKVADMTSIAYVYQICSFLPIIGVLIFLLPDLRSVEKRG
jgi:FSR family fosmidomycin resistance protein-like MFS transporter